MRLCRISLSRMITCTRVKQHFDRKRGGGREGGRERESERKGERVGGRD